MHRHSLAWWGLVVLALPAVSARTDSAAAQAGVEAMRAHFDQALVVHAAVIHGELAVAGRAAEALADQVRKAAQPGLSTELSALGEGARRVSEARDVLGAAQATADMLVACGRCHRAAGVTPLFPFPAKPDAGGVVGHMREHQAAADELVRGLVIPSDTAWRTGARALAMAPLQAGNLPADSVARRKTISTEERLHRLASDAAQASDPRVRSQFYAQFLAGCADCHHQR